MKFSYDYMEGLDELECPCGNQAYGDENFCHEKGILCEICSGEFRKAETDTLKRYLRTFPEGEERKKAGRKWREEVSGISEKICNFCLKKKFHQCDYWKFEQFEQNSNSFNQDNFCHFEIGRGNSIYLNSEELCNLFKWYLDEYIRPVESIENEFFNRLDTSEGQKLFAESFNMLTKYKMVFSARSNSFWIVFNNGETSNIYDPALRVIVRDGGKPSSTWTWWSFLKSVLEYQKIDGYKETIEAMRRYKDIEKYHKTIETNDSIPIVVSRDATGSILSLRYLSGMKIEKMPGILSIKGCKGSKYDKIGNIEDSKGNVQKTFDGIKIDGETVKFADIK